MTLVAPTRTTDTAAQEPLLSYDLTTNPDPLKASPENPASPEEIGELIIVGSRRSGTPADVEWIKVKVPAGPMSPDLATDLSRITPRISLKGWTVQLNAATKEFVFTPAASHETIGPDTGFTIQLSQIPINRKVGTSPITVTERSRTGNSAYQDRTTEFSVGKFPPDFYLRNLIANPLVIDNGCETTLTWERSTNATYELLYADTSLNVTNETTRTITNIKSDTTFYLRGTTGDPTNPVTRILTAQVTVRRPDLDVRDLKVRGKLYVDLEGELIVNGKYCWIHTLDIGNSLKVDHIHSKHEDTIKLSTVTVTGNISANGDVNIAPDKELRVASIASPHGHPAFNLRSGVVQIETAVSATHPVLLQKDQYLAVNEIRPAVGTSTVNITDGLSITGPITGPLSVTGPLNANGPLNVNGTVSLAGSPSLLPAHQSSYRTFSASTSGLVIGVANVTNSGSRGTIYVATGGHQTHSRWEHPGSATVVALVKKDQTFTIGPSEPSYSTTCEFYWLPFGAGSAIPTSMNDAEQLAERADGAQPPQTETDAET
ncbi:hypothetical protein ACIGXM_29840 [Kitasatospora sp. NPDC052896]|uniref:hypothetical protein n=1 Tax=Kitasatospora sp. NPDC052896 TaxID=3364061 RepID=UPI0037CB2FBD